MKTQDLPKLSSKQIKKLERLSEVESKKKSNSRRVFLWSTVSLFLVAAFTGMIVMARSSAPKTSPGTLIKPVTSEEHVAGAKDAKVVLVEYSDFQCPACGYYYPIIKQLKEEFKDKLLFAYRYFPLRSAHPYADITSQTAEAAGKQGKFWEMHDILFDNQKAITGMTNVKEEMIKYAQNLGLNIDQFKKDLDSQETKKTIDADLLSGQQSGVDSTPTFFLNGKKIQNPTNYEDFKSLINQNSATPS